MNSSFQTLKNQLDNMLFQLSKPKNLTINYNFSLILDRLNIPLDAKVATLSIDTAMNHLDQISYYQYERDAILIGDLLSAHYYHLISKLQDSVFHKKMSQAIISINELKSQLQHSHQTIPSEALHQTIYQIETLIIKTLHEIYQLEESIETLEHQIIQHLKVEHLTYLIHHSESEIQSIIHTLQNKSF
ncbi:heptaprenyl diphosphate synthase component 1 [Staphylococcus canis]|uniref:Heptaprenyl diphosphate synthase component 1 n=1 Tax=Staphylococcus canis TaxID=2724942 RepID=A0ABS0T9E3_9STAP|nr:heptaprenyl diphosphate synthase component 1 [Staphylococcus canis]MBI5975354.1 heptaprenyl diphosphate synthase component 1 [Staphylococcus canis]